MPKISLKLHALVALFLGLLVAVGYARIVNLSFLADDWAIIRLVTLPGDTTNWQTVLEGFYSPLFDRLAKYRPLYSLSLGVDYALFGTGPLGYHLTNLALHAANAFFVYLLALELTTGDRRREIATTAGAIFAIYPIHPEAVTWIAGRVDLICAVFFLPTLIFFARWLRTREWRELGLSLVCFALSLMAKEMAVTIPGLLFLLALYRGRGLINAARSILPFALLLGGYLAFRAYVLRGTDTYGVAGRELEVIASLQGFVYRTVHALFPLNFRLLPPGWQGFIQPLFFLLAAAIVILVAAAYYRGWVTDKLPVVLFALYAVALVPVFKSLRPDPDLIHARWLYIPSAFLAVLIAYLLWSAFGGRLWPSMLAATVVCASFFAILMANHGSWLQAGELTERYLESGEEPKRPVIYRGVHVFQNDITWISANSPPFDEP